MVVSPQAMGREESSKYFFIRQDSSVSGFWLMQVLCLAGVRHVKPAFLFTMYNLCLSINTVGDSSHAFRVTEKLLQFGLE